MGKKLLAENIIKNVILLIILYISYDPLKTSILNSGLTNDQGFVGDLLVVVSIIIAAASFGNFSFTYDQVRIEVFGERMMAHFTTGILMLTIGLSLETTLILTNIIIDNIFIFSFSLFLLYFSAILYDKWDLYRAYN